MKKTGLLLVLFALLSCNDSGRDYYSAIDSVAMVVADPEHPGKALLEKNCYSCHNPTTAHENRIAPPMFAIKKHYLRSGVTKEEFSRLIVNWTAGPSEEKAQMPGAIDKFGVMPYQDFDKNEVRLIAEYLYETALEKPQCCQQKMKMKRKSVDGHGRGKQMRRGMSPGKHGSGCEGSCCRNGDKI